MCDQEARTKYVVVRVSSTGALTPAGKTGGANIYICIEPRLHGDRTGVYIRIDRRVHRRAEMDY